MECDQKLKLIDISSEDDLFIDSHLFNSLEDLRLSVTMDNMNENGETSNLSRTFAKIDESIQVNEQKELKHLPSATIQPGRPSYLRKSSAWDNAFFTSAGLLDPDELSSMNKEFNTSEDHLMPVISEDVRARRPNIQSISNIRTGPRDMIDRSLVFKRKNINDARPKRSKTQQHCQRRECNSLKLKHPKVPWARSSAPIWQSKISRDMYSVDIKGKKKTGPGQDLMVSNSNTNTSSVSSTKTPIRSSKKSKKFENLSSSMEIHHHSSHKSPPSTTIARSLESSLSTSRTNRAHSDSNHRLNRTFGPGRNVWPPSHFTRPVASVPRENSQPSGLCMPSPKFGFFDEDISVERTFDGNSNQPQKQGMSTSIDMMKFVEEFIKAKRARSPISIDSVNRGSMKTLVLLSPIKSQYDGPITRAKKASCARKYGLDLQSKYPSGKYTDVVKKACSIMRKVCAGEHDRIGLVNEIEKAKVEIEKMLRERNKAINITPTTTPQSQTSRGRLYESSVSMSLNLTPSRGKGITSTSKSRNQENEVNDLSGYLELIDLNDGTETQLKQRKSFPHMRTPLVEKKSVCNRSLLALMRSDMVKDKESSNSSLSSKGTDKENN